MAQDEIKETRSSDKPIETNASNAIGEVTLDAIEKFLESNYFWRCRLETLALLLKGRTDNIALTSVVAAHAVEAFQAMRDNDQLMLDVFSEKVALPR